MHPLPPQLLAVKLGVLLLIRAMLSGPVVDVVDGDTIKVQLPTGIETVRYIGMDTPETVHPTREVEEYGAEASEMNRTLVLDQFVRLELDVEPRDRYGRLLAYVWVDSVMVNAELLRLGYAQLLTVPPNVRYVGLFRRLQTEAREAGRGLWAPPP
jgi:micrococcal nuclease